MSSLHTIESSGIGGGGFAAAQLARDYIRHALALLQAQANMHPAVDVAMESVAGSLSSIFALVRHGEAQAPASAAGASPVGVPSAAPAMAIPSVPVSNATMMGQPTSAAMSATAGYGSSGGFPSPSQPSASVSAANAQGAPTSAVSSLSTPLGNVPASVAAPMEAPPPIEAPPPPPPPGPVASASSGKQPVAAAQPVATEAGEAPVFEVALGTNSTSNFYKGLSGNDVVEHGGVFVATYNKLPPKDSQVQLHVTLPGAYEFQAAATVAWTREQRGGASDSIDTVPGFGARFTNIPAEGRQLVYRYVRNREPLFHDDF